MKKKIIIVLTILFVGLLVALGILYYNYVHYDVYEVPEEVTINLNENKFNVYEKHTSNELIKDINDNIISKEITLENEMVGTYKYTLE